MIRIVSKDNQAHGGFNGGQIVENKPIGFPQDGGEIRPYSNLFYWAYAEAKEESTIGLHPHQGFEIMSFVLKGTIRHFDSKQKQWIPLEAGDAQIIRAGKGIQHAEHMHEGSAIFQIWVDPDLNRTLQVDASYSDYRADVFPKTATPGAEVTTLIGEGSPFELTTENLQIKRIRAGKEGYLDALENGKFYSIYAISGSGKINGESFSPDDFIILSDETELKVEVENTADLFIISSPQRLDYQTYVEMMQGRMAGRS